ncbi:hypothetical protein ACFC53_14195 [Enterococcus casseliflavus]|uniref:DUF7006 family protein n=1 Tax=Enterococcus casseliflavus TaxID=37734 RepID=UPI0035E0ABDE
MNFFRRCVKLQRISFILLFSDIFIEIELAEEEIVKMIKKDKNVYYRQMAGIGTNQKAPHGLIYLSEK